jgi:hypothetical protein
MADAAYTVDTSSVDRLGENIGRAAYDVEQAKQAQQTTAMNKIQLEEAKKKQRDDATPIPIDTIAAPMKAKGFEPELNFLKEVSKPYVKKVGGVDVITKADMRNVTDLLKNNAELQNQFSQIHINNLSGQVSEKQKDLDELMGQQNSKLDRNGEPIKNPKLDAQIKQTQGSIAGLNKQISNTLYVTSEAERNRVEKLQAEQMKEENQRKIAAEHDKTRIEAAKISANKTTGTERTQKEFVSDYMKNHKGSTKEQAITAYNRIKKGKEQTIEPRVKALHSMYGGDLKKATSDFQAGKLSRADFLSITKAYPEEYGLKAE